jgi:DNA replication protein DnaC
MNTDIMASQPACPACGGSGWERIQETGSVRRCPCTHTGRIDRLLAEARIPKRYEHCDLDSYEPHDPTQKKAKSDVLRFLEKYPLIDVGLLLIGACGVGKTHLAVAVLKQIIVEKHDTGIFYDFRDLLREIQGSYNSVSQASEIEIVRPVLDANVLVLDELGANKPTEWVRDTLAYIINYRYNERRITILTSNYVDSPTVPGEESLTDRIGARLRSRLYEMCKVIKMEGKDFRKEIKQGAYRF